MRSASLPATRTERSTSAAATSKAADGRTTYTFNDYRIVIGAKGGVLDDKWDYDAWWQSGRNSYVSGNT